MFLHGALERDVTTAWPLMSRNPDATIFADVYSAYVAGVQLVCVFVIAINCHYCDEISKYYISHLSHDCVGCSTIAVIELPSPTHLRSMSQDWGGRLVVDWDGSCDGSSAFSSTKLLGKAHVRLTFGIDVIKMALLVCGYAGVQYLQLKLTNCPCRGGFKCLLIATVQGGANSVNISKTGCQGVCLLEMAKPYQFTLSSIFSAIL